jgi:hypothetical protein
MQALPNQPVWVIRQLLHQSSSKYLSPTDSFGYGIPNLKVAYETGKVLDANDILVDEDLFSIAPNPTLHTIHINTTLDNWILWSASGSLVQKGDSSSIEVGNLPDGVYYLQGRKGYKVQIKALVIKK